MRQGFGTILSKLSAVTTFLFLSVILAWPVENAQGQTAKQEEATALYPLKVGMKWEIRSDTDAKDSAKVEVTDTRTIGSERCYELATTVIVQNKPVVTWTYCVVKEDGVYQVASKTVGEGIGGKKLEFLTVFEPPIRSLKPLNKTAQTWDYDGRANYSKWECLFPPDAKAIKCSFRQQNDTIQLDGKDVEAILVVESVGGTELSKKWYLEGVGIVRAESGGRKFTRLGDVKASSPIKIGDVVLKKDTVEKEASSESVEALAGVVTEFERSRTITKELSYSTKIGAGAEVELKIAANLLVVKGDLTTRIKGSIEKETGEKLTGSETRKQSIKIDGNVLQKAKIVWIDIYRTGTVEVVQDGKAYSVPFEFPIGTKLVIRKQ